jgi:ABC-2 type transport system permease protein
MPLPALLALVRKDLVLYFSNRRAMMVTLAAPIAIAAFFGSLFGASSSSERSRIPIAIVDLDHSRTSAKLVAAMTAEVTFDVQPLDAAQAADAVRRGKLRAVLTLPAGFGQEAPRALFGGRAKPEIEIRYDPSQAIELQVVEGLLTEHVMQAVMQSLVAGDADNAVTRTARADVEHSTALSDRSRHDLLGLLDSVDRLRGDAADGTATNESSTPAAPGFAFELPYRTREVAAQAQQNTRYNAYSHSFAGMGVQFILFMGIDFGIKLLTMRRMGLWQRLRAAPLSRTFLLTSQVVSSGVIAALLFVGIMAAGVAFFGVRIDGSVVGFVGLIVAFAVMTSAFGLFIAALGKTPEATRGLAIFATLLMVMLGGAWVPAFVFPRWLQTASLIVPTRWAVDGFDAVTWRGLGLEAAWLPIVVQLAFALVFAGIAVWRFRWDEK